MTLCPYVCDNKTVGGYCRTTFCINPTHSNIGTVQYGQGEQKQIVTNADRFRAKSDEELAKFIERTMFMVYESVAKVCRMVGYEGQWDSEGIIREELEWLKQEAET